jgi:hypothetical protein
MARQRRHWVEARVKSQKLAQPASADLTCDLTPGNKHLSYVHPMTLPVRQQIEPTRGAARGRRRLSIGSIGEGYRRRVLDFCVSRDTSETCNSGARTARSFISNKPWILMPEAGYRTASECLAAILATHLPTRLGSAHADQRPS